MKNLLKNKYVQLGLSIFGVVGLSIIFFFLIYRWNAFLSVIKNIFTILMPIIYGLVIAYILNPGIKALESKVFNKALKKSNLPQEKIKERSRIFSIITSSIIFLIVLYLIVTYIIPEILTSIQVLIGNVPNYIKSIQDWLSSTLKNNPDVSNQILENYEQMSTYLMKVINESVKPNINDMIVNLSTGVVGVFKFLYNFIIGFIISIYLLAGKENYIALTKKVTYSVFSKKIANDILEKCRFINQIFGKYMMGVLIDSCAVGIIIFIFSIIFQMPYAMLISVICAVTNAIPYFGPFIGAIPSGLLILLVSPPKAIIFAIFIVILQQFDGMYLAPKIIGNQTGLKRFWVLCAILIFGGLFGFIGLLIGVPLFAIIYTFVKDYINDNLKSKKLSSSTKKYNNLSYINNENEYVYLEDHK